MSLLDAKKLAGGDASLAKIKIFYEDQKPGVFVGPIEALFNPSRLRYDQTAQWQLTQVGGQPLAAGYQKMEFQATSPVTLAVELFFDTYEGDAIPGGTGLLRGLQSALLPDSPLDAKPSAVSVTKYTDRIASLARVNTELHRPPICKLFWGQQQLLVGALVSLAQDFTFFMPDGTPVRATLTCQFQEYVTFVAAARAAETHSADVEKRRVVRRGDTLDAIAAAEYGDPARWRAIAAANGIDNPRALAPGQALVIPKLRT